MSERITITWDHGDGRVDRWTTDRIESWSWSPPERELTFNADHGHDWDHDGEPMPEHDPTVMPYAEAVDKWIVVCSCGLSEKYETQTDAEERAHQHVEETR